MNEPIPYFQNDIARIAYVPAGYVRLAWEAAPADDEALRAIYEQLLLALAHFATTDLLGVHGQRQPLPAAVQAWLISSWIPRAVALVGYGRYAIVEAATPAVRHATRTVVDGLSRHIDFQYFDTEADAHGWLTGRL